MKYQILKYKYYLSEWLFLGYFLSTSFTFKLNISYLNTHIHGCDMYPLNIIRKTINKDLPFFVTSNISKSSSKNIQ